MTKPPPPVQVFLSSPVVLLSFIRRFALVRYQIGSNMTESRKKIWSSINKALNDHLILLITLMVTITKTS